MKEIREAVSAFSVFREYVEGISISLPRGSAGIPVEKVKVLAGMYPRAVLTVTDGGGYVPSYYCKVSEDISANERFLLADVFAYEVRAVIE
jgi:hypothetical protein